MADRRGPKGPRNKVKQVVLIEGHPDCIFETKEKLSVSMKINGTVIKLGHMGEEKLEALKTLKSMPGVEIIEELIPRRRAKSLPSVMFVKTTKTSTQLTVAALDKDALDKAVTNLAHHLSGSGINIQERCRWVCEIDKGGQPVQPEPKTEPPPNPSTVSSDTSSVKVKVPVVHPEPSYVQTKDRIMDYLKNRSEFNAREISDKLNIPIDTVKDVLVDLGFSVHKTKRNMQETDFTGTAHKGRYGSVMEMVHAPG